MSLAKLQKNIQEYQNGLYQTAHSLDSISDFICDILQRLGSVQNDATALTALIQNEMNLPFPVSESEAKAFYENMQGLFFSISVLSPLRLSLNYIDSKGKNTLESIHLEDCDFDTDINSARGLYELIIQLPESIVLPRLQDICAKNDSYLLMDAFERKDADSFVEAFERQNNKKAIIDAFVSKANKVALINNAWETFKPNAKLTIWDFFELSQKTILQTCNRPGLELSYRTAKDPQRILFADPSLMEHELWQAYKTSLLEYLSKKDIFDDFETKTIEGIIQDQNFVAFTEKLLAECEEELKRESNLNTPENNELHPLAFPYNHIKINKNQVKPFLEELYRTLLNSEGKQYIEKGCEEQFVFLLGGSDECPASRAPLLWLKQKNELQALLIALYGENAGNNPGWEVLKKYFWWKQVGRVPELANSSGSNISTIVKTKFDNIVKTAKKEASSNLS